MKILKKVVSIVVVSSMILGLAACNDTSKKSKKSKKEKSDISEEQVVEVAEDFTKALLDMNTKKIEKLSSSVKDSTIEDIELITSENGDNASTILDTVKFEFEEDDVEIDDDEASIDIEYSYTNGYAFGVDGILDDFAETGKFTLEFDIDDDDVLVSNADKICENFYSEVFDDGNVFYEMNPVGSVDPVDPYSDLDVCPYFVWSQSYEIAPDGTMYFDIECYDYSFCDGKTLEVSLESYEEVLVTYETTFESNTTISYSFTPEDIGLDEFDEEEYYLYVSCDEIDYYDYDFCCINDFMTSSNGDVTGIVAGNTYTNYYFGFTCEISEDLVAYDIESYDFMDEFGSYPEAMYVNETAVQFIEDGGWISDDDIEGFAVAILYMDGGVFSDIKEFYDSCPYEVELVEKDDITFIRVPGDPVNQAGAVFIKDGAMLMIFANGEDDNMHYLDELIDSIEGIS